MEYLLSNHKTLSLQKQLDMVAGNKDNIPFDEIVVEFINDLSKLILLDKNFRKFPEIIAVGHWLRASNIKKMQIDFEKLKAGRFLVPKGCVLHFAPSNVDTIFVYSWVISLLLGNKNIIRLSRKKSAVVDTLLNLISTSLLNEKYNKIANGLLIVSYDYDIEITELLSKYCDIRVIWGGDKTIDAIRTAKLPSRSTDLVFANRFSIAAINSSYVNSMSDHKLTEVVKLFYRDSFTYDQNACSSPKAVFFVGNLQDVLHAKQRFWSMFETYLEENNPWEATSVAVAMTRFTNLTQFSASKKIASFKKQFFDIPCVAEITTIDNEMREIHSGGGFFLEGDDVTLSDVIRKLNKKDQTLILCGFSKNDLDEIKSELPTGAIDRIVPVGKALEFYPVWDGYNLFLEFTREIYIDDSLYA